MMVPVTPGGDSTQYRTWRCPAPTHGTLQTGRRRIARRLSEPVEANPFRRWKTAAGGWIANETQGAAAFPGRERSARLRGLGIVEIDDQRPTVALFPRRLNQGIILAAQRRSSGVHRQPPAGSILRAEKVLRERRTERDCRVELVRLENHPGDPVAVLAASGGGNLAQPDPVHHSPGDALVDAGIVGEAGGTPFGIGQPGQQFFMGWTDFHDGGARRFARGAVQTGRQVGGDCRSRQQQAASQPAESDFPEHHATRRHSMACVTMY
ncbi:MAG: hypothetical protein H6R23_900 [Proteobacteria bacterium]|nr:hypothetical protein [Pseudomonadota bacterium]